MAQPVFPNGLIADSQFAWTIAWSKDRSGGPGFFIPRLTADTRSEAWDKYLRLMTSKNIGKSEVRSQVRNLWYKRGVRAVRVRLTPS
jgi:hypothetical protein